MNRKTTAVLFGAALLLPFAGTLSASRSEHFGGVKTILPEGHSAPGISFIKPTLLAGKVASASVDSITLTRNYDFFQMLSGGTSYYLEVVDGTAEGNRFQIDWAATLQNEIPTLDLNHEVNTAPDASFLPIGSRVVIRSHFTLNDFTEAVGEQNLVSGTSSGSADKILFWDRHSDSWNTYWYFQDPFGGGGKWWAKVGTSAGVDQGDTEILPGVGFVFTRQDTIPLTFTFAGTVRENAFRFNLPTGLTFRSSPFPSSNSPASWNMMSPMFTQAVGSDGGDEILVWGGSSFIIYKLHQDDNWYSSDGSFTIVTNELFFRPNNSFFIKPVNPIPSFMVYP